MVPILAPWSTSAHIYINRVAPLLIIITNESNATFLCVQHYDINIGMKEVGGWGANKGQNQDEDYHVHLLDLKYQAGSQGHREFVGREVFFFFLTY